MCSAACRHDVDAVNDIPVYPSPPKQHAATHNVSVAPAPLCCSALQGGDLGTDTQIERSADPAKSRQQQYAHVPAGISWDEGARFSVERDTPHHREH